MHRTILEINLQTSPTATHAALQPLPSCLIALTSADTWADPPGRVSVCLFILSCDEGPAGLPGLDGQLTDGTSPSGGPAPLSTREPLLPTDRARGARPHGRAAGDAKTGDVAFVTTAGETETDSEAEGPTPRGPARVKSGAGQVWCGSAGVGHGAPPSNPPSHGGRPNSPSIGVSTATEVAVPEFALVGGIVSATSYGRCMSTKSARRGRSAGQSAEERGGDSDTGDRGGGEDEVVEGQVRGGAEEQSAEGIDLIAEGVDLADGL